MSRHVPRDEALEQAGPQRVPLGRHGGALREGGVVVLVSYRQRGESAPADAPPVWHEQAERIGPFKRPRNAMMAAEERVLLLGRRHGDNVRFEASNSSL